MKATVKDQIPKLLAEGVVIVVSVLLALSADAWWSRVEDGRRMDDHVRALSRDFEQMAQRNDTSLQVARRSEEAGFAFLAALGNEEFSLLSDSSGVWLKALGQYEAFSPSTGAYEALIASGDLELLPDAELKRGLAEFFGSFEDVRVTERGLRESQDSFFLSEAFADSWGVHRLLGYPDDVADGQNPPSPEVLREWAESNAFLNGLTWLILNNVSAVEDYEFLQQELDGILPELDDYLAEAGS